MDVNSKRWKLYRAVYNHFGLMYVEGSFPKERFEEVAARGYGIKYIIGVRVKRNRHYEIDVVVEGPQEALRHILELVAKGREMVEVKYSKSFKKTWFGLDEDASDAEAQKVEEELIKEIGEAIASELGLH